METEQYQVLHIEKRVAIPSGLNRHITREEYVVLTEEQKTVIRQWVPDNASPERTRLNRELISRVWSDTPDAPPRKHTVQDQVNRRLQEAGVKVRKGQNSCLEIILSGSPETMGSMSRDVLLQWAEDSLKWARKEFGKENVVNATLHVDEKTPHIHMVVVPLVSGMSRSTLKDRRKNKKNKTYNVDHSKLRLCANEVFSNARLRKMHNNYHEEVSAIYGLHRGIEAEPGSVKNHESSIEYNRRLEKEKRKLEEQAKHLQDEIAEKEKEQEQIKSSLKDKAFKLSDKVLSKLTSGQSMIESQNSSLNERIKELQKENDGLRRINTANFHKIKELQRELTEEKGNRENEKKSYDELEVKYNRLATEKENLFENIAHALKELYKRNPGVTEILDRLFKKYLNLDQIKKEWEKFDEQIKQNAERKNTQSKGLGL